METMLLIAQTAVTACLCGWIAVGAYDNWRHPALNREAVAAVLRLDMLARDYPEVFDRLRHRRIDSEAVIGGIFRAVVLWETFAALLLLIGAGALALALLGAVDVEAARVLAMTGALAFTLTWAGFLVCGDWFAYWFCHQWAQASHFFLALWGVGAMILLALPG